MINFENLTIAQSHYPPARKFDINDYYFQKLNGQNKYGPPKYWEGKPPPDDTELFISNLPQDNFEESLMQLFSLAGRVYMLRTMQHFSGINRGFAFIQFFTRKEADKAINMFNNFLITPRKKIFVKWSLNKSRLFLSNIETNLTAQAIKHELSVITENLVDVIVDKNLDQNNSGSAILVYNDHKAAALARRILIPILSQIWNSKVGVDWADEDKKNLNSFKTKNLFCANIKPSITNEELDLFFSINKKLNVLSIKRLKNHAFIHYATRSEAEIALNVISSLKSEVTSYLTTNKEIFVNWAKYKNQE